MGYTLDSKTAFSRTKNHQTSYDFFKIFFQKSRSAEKEVLSLQNAFFKAKT